MTSVSSADFVKITNRSVLSGSVLWNEIGSPDGNQSLDMGSYDTAWTSLDTWTFDGLDIWTFADAKLLLPSSTTLPTTDCDAAGEAGRIYVDTDAATGAQLYVCEGAAGWVLSSGTEVDTLATVTGRGATTTTASTFSGGINDGTATLLSGSLTSVKLGSLTSNGFVKTGSGNGTLSVDTATYLTTVDISANTNLAAGRSLTMSGDSVEADAELYTRGFTWNLEYPATALTGLFQRSAHGNITITKVSCSTNTGTVTINIDERAKATPNTTGSNVLSAGLVCDTNTQTSCASGCDVNTITNGAIDSTDPMALLITAVASSPTMLRVDIELTKDD